MANQFSDQQRKAIILAFQQLDKDADGRLSREEVAALIRDMDYSSNEQQIDRLISEVDADSNGTIQPGQFLALMARMMSTITEEKDILESFSILEEKPGQAITFESLKEVFNKMGQTKITDDDIRNMIAQADLTGDGKVTLEEFKKLLKR